MRIFLLTSTLLFVSCISQNYEPTTLYDIKPEYNAPKVSFQMETVSLQAPYSSKVTYRQGNKLVEKEFSRWSSSPEKMLQRYWMLLPKTVSAVKLRGVVRVFEINMDSETADIVFDYEVNNTWKQIVIRESLSGIDVESAVTSMEKAVEKLTSKLSKK
ncbi:MAG: hypothetical protein NE330_19960 [Lentisphaeraceae bacterium]|nr:hypothetical protein [Lentisphaeraceae bacterium]